MIMASSQLLMSSLVFLLLLYLAQSQGGDSKPKCSEQVLPCPDTKPVPCLPNFQCCTYAQFCSNKSHSCEPCFGGLTDQVALQHCLSTPDFKRGACKYACYDKFPEEMENRHTKGQDQQTQVGLNVFVPVVSLLMIVIIMLTVFYNRHMFKCKNGDKDFNVKLTNINIETPNNRTEPLLAHSNDSLAIDRRIAPLPQKSTPFQPDLEVNHVATEAATEEDPLLCRNVDSQLPGPAEDAPEPRSPIAAGTDPSAADARPTQRGWSPCISPTNHSDDSRVVVVTSATTMSHV